MQSDLPDQRAVCQVPDAGRSGNSSKGDQKFSFWDNLLATETHRQPWTNYSSYTL